MKTKTNRRSPKKQRTKRIIIASVAVGAAGILGYFGWQYLRKKKQSGSNTDLDKLLQPGTVPALEPTFPTYTPPKASSPPKPKTATPSYTRPSYTPPSPATGFPLKKGSKGENVRLLQQALIAKHGNSILPKYGADGDFGTETVNALKKAGFPTSIDQSTFNVLTQGSRPDTSTLGKDLYTAAAAKNFSKVISLLKTMQSVDDYTRANDVFKTYRLGSVRQTIVNGLLNVFTSVTQKEAIRMEFLRIGLQYDGNKWSLSGFDGRPIVTSEATTVWINPTDGVKVPARMVLGNEVSRRLDYTLFENNGKYFLVYTKAVQYLG